MSDTEEDGLGLGGVFTEPPRPPTPEPTFATHTRSSDPRELRIRLVGAHPLWGHHLWNAARVFSDYLDRNAETMCKGKNVLELGAGGALPSLIAALNGARKVVITDYPDDDLIRNIEVNVDANLSSHLRDAVVAKGYIWGTPTQPLLECLPPNEKFDVILLSDLVFNHSQHTALLKTCAEALAPSPAACVLVFYTHHRPHLAHKDMEFFRLAREEGGWTCEEIVTERMQAMFPEDSGDEEVRSTVHGWKLTLSSS